MTAERFAVSWANPKRQARVAAGDPLAPLALVPDAIMLQHPAMDRAIRYLSILWDEPQRTALFRRCLPGAGDLSAFSWRFLRYKPERRCVIGIEYQGTPLAVVRCASAREYGNILLGCITGAALGQHTLLDVCGEWRMVTTGWVAGISLDHLITHPASASLMARAGRALADVHKASFSLPVTRSEEDNLQQMWRVLATLNTVYPAAAEQFRSHASRISQHLGRFAAEPVLLHGDFSADQVILPDDNSALRIIDWDRCAHGHPLVDIATFCARLELDVIGQQISREQADQVSAAMLAGYSAVRPLAQQGLSWYTAWALLCLAIEPFRRRAPRWPQLIDALLQRAEQLIGRSLPVSAEWQQQLATLSAISPMAAPLKQALNLPEDQLLLSCEVIRHKPGRRALIDYQFGDSHGQVTQRVLGKYRAKGTDERSFACQQALWRHGFGQYAEVCVPEPLAVMPTHHMWLQRKLDAQSMMQSLSPEIRRASQIVTGAKAGRALAAVQCHPQLRGVVADRRWQLADELWVLQQGMLKVSLSAPHWQSRLTRLFSRCEALAERLTSAPERCLHRDFYPDQLMTDNQEPARLIVLDFDLCCVGPAALDAGNYLAHVQEFALRTQGDSTALQHHEAAFLAAYLADSPGIDEKQVKGFLALSLTRHIYLSTQFPERMTTTEQLLTICEQLMEA